MSDEKKVFYQIVIMRHREKGDRKPTKKASLNLNSPFYFQR